MTPVPDSFNIGNGDTDSSLDMERFFSEEGGSISKSSIACKVYVTSIDISNPSLTLHSGFINAIKTIDLAKSDSYKKVVMHSFIESYGTHYAKRSVMGVGTEFQTR